MSRKIYNRLSFMAVSWLDESTLGMSYRKENQVQVTRIFWTMRRLWLP